MIEDTSVLLQALGAGCFGAVIGWYVYYINRHRGSDIKPADLVSVINVLGGGSILAIFPERSMLFGAYGVGLFVGFFSYFLCLLVMVRSSRNFDVDWFLDGRRQRMSEGQERPPEVMVNSRPMLVRPKSSDARPDDAKLDEA